MILKTSTAFHDISYFFISMIVMHRRHWNHSVPAHINKKSCKTMQDMLTHHTMWVCSHACAVLSGALAKHITEVNLYQFQSRSLSLAYIPGKNRRKSWFNTVYFKDFHGFVSS